MAKKKTETHKAPKGDPSVVGLVGRVDEAPITETLERNFMPYAMSVNLSRAIPEIDGFKPSQRKLLYTMYKMGLLNGNRTKSANIVGQTMRLNPHGEGAIYDTMVRLSTGYEALLSPFVDSKGNFGKVYSRDMACAASRYTEARLAPIANELFAEIDKDTVDYIPNYDATTTEPSLLPTTFPNILVSSNTGIGVAMGTNICGYNLSEVCRATVAFLKDEKTDLIAHMPAPDFPTGGEIIYDEEKMRSIYETGKGGFRVRAKWRFIKEENIIEIYEIPYTTTAEAIIDKTVELIKAGKIKEISDMRDETGLSGLKIAVDLKRSVDPDRLMAKLMRLTPLSDTYSCNFNVLIAGTPRTLGVRELLAEWCAWRRECVMRRIYAEKQKKEEKLHLLKGLSKILLDIDKAIRIIRETEEEREVVPNLMIGFGIDETQADYIAEIRLRHINREYIMKRTEETAELEREIADLKDILESPRRVRDIIIAELNNTEKKYGTPRRSEIIYEHEIVADEPVIEEAEEYPVTVFVSSGGYIKKITPQSLRMSSEQKFKEGDELKQTYETRSTAELLVFTDQKQCYKTKLTDFEDTKASALGTFLPTALSFDPGENVVFTCDPADYSGSILFFFENGKIARVTLDCYSTKLNRKKLTGAFSDKSTLVAALIIKDEPEIAVYSNDGRALIFTSAQLAPKTTRNTQGVQVLSLRRNTKLADAKLLSETVIKNRTRYLTRSIPAAGAKLEDNDSEVRQLTLL